MCVAPSDGDGVEVPGDGPWLVEGHEGHVESAAGPAAPILGQVERALGLLAWALGSSADAMQGHMFPNDLGALACFTQAFRALQGSVLLGMTGYYMQARALMRTCYESAGLGRLIAKDPQLAEKWLRKQQWVPDREVRAGIEAQTVPDGSSSPYAAHYRIASAAAHPTARATLGQVLTAGGGVRPVLSSVFVEDDLVMVLREAAALAVFACFALQRAAADERALPPAWRRDLAVLAREVTGEAMPHLDRDWDREQDEYVRLQALVLPAADLDGFLSAHPNSWVNTQGRSAARGEGDA